MPISPTLITHQSVTWTWMIAVEDPMPRGQIQLRLEVVGQQANRNRPVPSFGAWAVANSNL